MNLLAEGISKTFLRENRKQGTNQFTAVAQTDLLLRGGTLTVLTGRSGSGKSTLLHMLAALSRPDTGRVLLGGTDLYALEDQERSALRARQFGIIPQGVTALYALTVRENILLPAQIAGEQPDPAAADALMKQLDIAALSEERPAALSGGELRRTAIARALLLRPAVILADEPTSDLDDENTASVFRLLKQKALEGAAVFVVTHDSDAAQYADIVLRMDAGTLHEM